VGNLPHYVFARACRLGFGGKTIFVLKREILATMVRPQIISVETPILGQGRWKMVGIIPEEVFRDLLTHYQKAGLGSQLLESDSSETISGEKAIKINSRKFDLVILKFASGSIGAGRGFSVGPSISKQVTKMGPTNINFHYIVKGIGKQNENDLKAEVKEKKEGLISKKLVDIKWEGGKLAGLLNSDSELKNMIMRFSVVPLKVEADRKNDCVRIINEKGIKITIESSGIFLKETKTRAENFPPIETLDVIDKIADYVKSI